MLDLCLYDGVKLQYPAGGESLPPLQSVKSIWIAIFTVLDGLRFGFNI
jgi:hypothetical protein